MNDFWIQFDETNRWSNKDISDDESWQYRVRVMITSHCVRADLTTEHSALYG
jgi:hypothetical protein